MPKLIGVSALSLSRFRFDESFLNWNECALFTQQVSVLKRDRNRLKSV